MFQRTIPMTTGDECATTISHNFTGASEPAEAAEDEAWTSESTNETSNQVFFGRVEGSDDGGAVLIVGTSSYVGVQGEGGNWTFSWAHTSSGETNDTHASGYQFDWQYDDAVTTTIAGVFTADGFVGTWEDDSESTDKYTESDTWSDEAAAYVGTTGLTPASTYLVVTDAYGVQTAASNTYQAYDCDAAGCALTVQTACAYRYDLTATGTDFEPDDEGWVSDAGQTAGL